MKFVIKSSQHHHKDQLIELDFSKMKIITDLNFHPHTNREEKISQILK
jgi:hypothetical protein